MSTQKCKRERKNHLLEYVWNLSREPSSYKEVEQKIKEELREVWQTELELPLEGKIQ